MSISERDNRRERAVGPPARSLTLRGNRGSTEADTNPAGGPVLRGGSHTPRAIVDRFSNALAETLREPAIKSRIEAMQITMQIGGPDVQRKFLADQMKLWGPVVKEHNIKTDS